MNSLLKRCLTAVIAIPAIFSLIFFLPQYHHLAFASLAFVASLIGSLEMQNLILKAEGQSPHLRFWVPSILIIAAWIETFFEPLPITDFVLLFLALLSFSMEIVYGAKDSFKGSLARTASSSLLLLYPSFFFTFLIKICEMDWEGNANYSTFLLLLYFLLVFGNDTFAYIFGMAFGKNNRGVLKVSPNKSIAGFIGGTVVTTILSVAYCMFIDIGLGIVQSVVLGVVISFSANVGDLVESAFKRAAEVKDSGHIVPGRGGFLDSIDSLLASAPVFWVLFVIFRA